MAVHLSKMAATMIGTRCISEIIQFEQFYHFGELSTFECNKHSNLIVST